MLSRKIGTGVPQEFGTPVKISKLFLRKKSQQFETPIIIVSLHLPTSDVNKEPHFNETPSILGAFLRFQCPNVARQRGNSRGILFCDLTCY